MRSLKIAGLAIAGVVFLSSCAGIAKIEKDETVDFSKYKTFAWAEGSDESSITLPSGLQDRNLHTAVNAELGKASYSENNEKPDLLLKHDLLVEKKVKQTNNPVYSRSFSRPYFNPYTRHWNYIYYPGYFMGYDRRQYEVKEGTLTLSIIDAKTDKMVWQGWTTNELRSANVSSKELEKGVRTILRSFNKS